MIKLKTEVGLPLFKKKMGYRHPTVMMGSCFAGNIGDHLAERCFPITVNPFGTLYNPVSISTALEHLIDNKKFTGQDLFFYNNLYHSFFHHGRFSRPDGDEMLQLINGQNDLASTALKKCSHLFVTFGTSWVFSHKTMGVVVSNCHKLPVSTFERYRLSIDQIMSIWVPLIGQLVNYHPDIHLVFTVSPIRHLKDGAHENQISKSILLMAIEGLSAHFGDELISYFPSYELLLDEMRDYRFYAADMAHPSEVATALIIEKFESALFDQEAKAVSSELKKLVLSIKHKPFDINNIDYQLFIKGLAKKAQELQKDHPHIDLSGLIKKMDDKL